MENIVRKRMTVCGVSALCALALAGGICLIAPPAAAQVETQAETHDQSGWEELTSAGGEMGGGTYYLTDDVELQSDLSVTGEVTLCLNGHILKGTGRDSVISVQNGADFTLCDCNGSQSTHYYTVDEDGLYIFDGVTADTPEAQPLEGGVVTGGYGGSGGGIYVYGSTFTMEGGKVSDNFAYLHGGGIYVKEGAVTMKGGTVSGNDCNRDGGGIYSADSTIDMSDGSIEENQSCLKTTNGGGAIYANIDSTLTISGGQIVNNSIVDGLGGGAILTHSDTTLQLGGAPVIAGNTFNEVENNFFLRTEARLQFIAPLEEGAKIGVNLYNHDLEEEYRNTTGVFTQDYSAENTADPSQYFFADNAKYAVIWNEDGEAEIVVNSYTVICVGLDGTRTEREFTVGEPLTLDEVPAEEGYLGGWTQAYGGASIDYAGGQTLAEGLGQAPGDVITLYAVQARDLAGDVDGILSGLEQAAAALGSGDLAAGLASLTQQIGAAQEAIDALEGDRVTQDKLEAAVEAAQAALEEQIEAVQAELETTVGQLQASIASGEADAAALEEGLAALEEALRAAETLLGGDISALEEQLGALEEAYAAADDAVMDAVEALRADNAAMTTALWLVGAAAVVALAAGAAALVVALTARKRG